MIRAENLGFTYPNGLQVLQDISFRIKKGEFVALIGRNGSGKTTLLKHFNGLLKPTSGRLLIAGLDTARAKVAELARKVGFLFQNPDHQIFLPTVADEIAFGPKNLGLKGKEIEARVEEAAAQVGLTDCLDASPLKLGKGQRQRVALASVLAMRPDILVLDEPTTGQDYRQAREIMEIIKGLHRKGHTIVLVTHDMEIVARYAERALVLGEGRLLLEGPLTEVFSREDVLARAGLLPPSIVRLIKPYREAGLFRDVLTPEDLCREITLMLRGEAHVARILPA
ncbi:ATP-binding cassette domain-containing protein [Moorellaceae bacterium AZ2]